MQTIADLLGVTTGELTIMIVVAVVLAAGWTIARRMIKMAVRTFTLGFLGLIIAIVVLYVMFVAGQ